MAVSKKVEMDMLRSQFLTLVSDYFSSLDEEVLRVKSNEIAIPCVGCEDNEYFMVITFKVPTGANKGLEPYDGYEMAEDYERSLKEKAEKAKVKAEEKERKRQRDEEVRRKRAENKGQQTLIFYWLTVEHMFAPDRSRADRALSNF